MQWPGLASSGLSNSSYRCSQLVQDPNLWLHWLRDSLEQRFHRNDSSTRGASCSCALLLQVWNDQASICIRTEENLLQTQCSALTGVWAPILLSREANGQNDEMFHHSKTPHNSLRSGCYFHTFSRIFAVEQDERGSWERIISACWEWRAISTFSHFFQGKNLTCRI